MKSLLRFPGGKYKILDQILSNIKIANEYREPFFGGGSIGLNVLESNLFNKIWINDKDPGIASLWTSVIRYSGLFKEKIKAFIPSVDSFYEFKECLFQVDMPDFDDEENIVEIGFKKLAIHQISYSGLGTKSGGPLGGKEQKSKYHIGCRWSPNYICNKIDKINNIFNNVDVREKACTNYDFDVLIKDKLYDSMVYNDPPYYEKGIDLYQFAFDREDHERLAELLKETKHSWLLSYDNHEEIKKLYSWAKIDEISLLYSITGIHKKNELLIWSFANV